MTEVACAISLVVLGVVLTLSKIVHIVCFFVIYGTYTIPKYLQVLKQFETDSVGYPGFNSSPSPQTTGFFTSGQFLLGLSSRDPSLLGPSLQSEFVYRLSPSAFLPDFLYETYPVSVTWLFHSESNARLLLYLIYGR